MMTDRRKELHDQVEQTRERDIERLVDFINRFLRPSESHTSQRIVFEPVPPGSKAAAEIEKQRQHALARRRASRSEMLARSLGATVTRLGIDLNNITEGSCSWSGSGDKSSEFTCSWFEGRRFTRLGMFHVNEQQVVTSERCHVSETPPELTYKVRVLTPTGDAEKELTVPI
jgi:hypothetical protein